MSGVEIFKASHGGRNVPLWFEFKMYKFKFLCLYFSKHYRLKWWHSNLCCFAFPVPFGIWKIEFDFGELKFEMACATKNNWTCTFNDLFLWKYYKMHTKSKQGTQTEYKHIISLWILNQGVILEIYTFLKSDFSGFSGRFSFDKRPWTLQQSILNG